MAVAFVACVLAAAFSTRGVRGAGEFTPQSVFARDEAHSIDERCADARDFAKRAAKGTADIDAYAAYRSERAFVSCLQLPRVNPDVDAMRYLLLCAATSAYLAATLTGGATSVILYQQADEMAATLGAKSPDRPWDQVMRRIGRPNGDATELPHPSAFYEWTMQRSIFGQSHALSYSDVANQLEDAITKSITAASATAPSPAPAPSHASS